MSLLRNVLCFSVASLCCFTAAAQEVSEDPPAEEAAPVVSTDEAASTAAETGTADGLYIEEIIVTAQKRSENLQQVPIAINAFSGDTLEQAGARDAQDLANLTPGLSVSANNGVFLPFLRGIGNEVPTAGNESSTAMYVDGIYVPRLSTGFLRLNNIERVEVLKGPQGTLFGRNASGGVIHIITHDPGQERVLKLGAGYANYDTTSNSLYAAGGITDSIAADFAVYRSDQGEGWGRNLFSGKPVGYQKTSVLQSKWIFQLGESTRLKLIGNYVEDESTQLNTKQFAGLPGGVLPFYTEDPYNVQQQQWPTGGFYDANFDVDQRADARGHSFSATLSHEFDFATLTSLSSYRESIEKTNHEGDFTSLPGRVYHLPAESRTVTQEVQLASAQGSPFTWVAGLYYLNARAEYWPFTYSGESVGEQFGGLPVGTYAELYGRQETDDYAAFAQATFPILSTSNLTLGLRYTRDEIDGDRTVKGVLPDGSVLPFGASDQEVSYSKLTYKAAIDHHFTEAVMAYASVSRGFKAGTFNLLSFSGAPAADPEVLDAYEIGFKGSFLNRRLQVNGAAFYYDVSDPQLLQIQNGLVEVSNAQASESQGVDLDVQFLASEGLLLRAGFSWLDTEYSKFSNAPLMVPNPEPPYGAIRTTGDASGNPLIRAPEFSFNVGFNYRQQTGVGYFIADVGYAYRSEFEWFVNKAVQEPSLGLLDAALTYQPVQESLWSLRIWGRNLTDERYAQTASVVEGPVGFLYGAGPPRTYGMSISIDLH